MKLNTEDFKSRCLNEPHSMSWENKDGGFRDSYTEKPQLNYEGLSEHEKVALFIFSWTQTGYVTFKRSIMNEFGFTKYKVTKIIREISDHISIETSFREDDGLIAGRGYMFIK